MTQVQAFKGDSTETKMAASAEPAFALAESALDDFREGGSESAPFLLMLYDAGRMPFSQRINREVFVPFIKRALSNFPQIGNFESYIFILKEVFGEESDILFEVTAPGKLSISVNAVSDVGFEAIAREFVSGSYQFFNLGALDGEDFLFRGLPGIETQYELSLLFAEIMPAGLFPSITLEFYSKSVFIGSDGSNTFDVSDHLGNQIIFIEIGG